MIEWHKHEDVIMGIEVNAWHVKGTPGNNYDAVVSQAVWDWVAVVGNVGCRFETGEEAKEWAEKKLGGNNDTEE